MRAKYFGFVLCVMLLSCFAEKASAQTLGVADIDPMYQTYKANEARFIRNYVGKTFSASFRSGRYAKTSS